MIPNVRVLNLNYNFLEDARPLEGLTRLRKLTIIGSRIKGTKQLIRVLKGMLDVEMLDFRYALRFLSFCLLRVPASALDSPDWGLCCVVRRYREHFQPTPLWLIHIQHIPVEAHRGVVTPSMPSC